MLCLQVSLKRLHLAALPLISVVSSFPSLHMEGCNEICLAGMGGRVPTWRMVAGSSTESLALDVALQCQVPADIVQRAAYLFKVTFLLFLFQNSSFS